MTLSTLTVAAASAVSSATNHVTAATTHVASAPGIARLANSPKQPDAGNGQLVAACLLGIPPSSC